MRSVTVFSCGLLVLLVPPELVRAGSLPPRHKSDKDMHTSQPRISDRTIQYNSDEQGADHWNNDAQNILNDHLKIIPNTNVARNVIMFLGDGMSVPTLAASRAYQGQLAGKSGEESHLVFENFPYTGLSKTYCVNSQVADSACTATAYLCGVKANIATIGVTAAVPRGDCQAMRNASNHVSSLLKWAQDAGKATGIVTTARVTHASPAGAYANVADRDWENDAEVIKGGQDPTQCEDIAQQLVFGDTGKNIKVILGGGRQNFIPKDTLDEEGQKGKRKDGQDLVAAWQNGKIDDGFEQNYVWNRQQLLCVDTSNTDYLLGLFEGSHMQYHLEADELTEPTLEEMTEVAIKILLKEDKGFALFVEGGKIDHAHHATQAHRALDETVELAKAVEKALQLTMNHETLIVVTADHAHTMSYSGYPTRGNNILGLAGNSGVDKLPYSTLSYANGPGYKSPEFDGGRYDLSQDDMENDEYQFPALAPLSSETHGGDDVAVFATGPWAHLLSGLYEQNYIPHMMAYAACIGPGLTACSNDKR